MPIRLRSNEGSSPKLAPRARPVRLCSVEPEFYPLTLERWPDLVRLFGSRGACGGCWCMTPRLSSADYERGKGEGNRKALRDLVRRGREPGLLGYLAHEPVAWCSIEPREAFVRLANSRILKPVDERPVWSITCLFIHKDHRRQGLSVAALRAAVDHARERGAECVEGYPVEAKQDPMPPVFAYTGLASAFLHAGFEEVARRSPHRPILRIECNSPPPARRLRRKA